MRSSVFIVSLFVLLLTGADCARSLEPLDPSEALVLIPEGALESGEPVSVVGPWEFYWDRLVMPGEFQRGMSGQPDRIMARMKPWNVLGEPGSPFGALGKATYRLRLRSAKPLGRLCITFPHQWSAWRAYANGILISESGRIGTGPEDHVPGRSDILTYFETQDRDLELVFQVGNYHNPRGGLRGRLILGGENAVTRYAQQRQALEMTVLGIILGAAIYHLFFYAKHHSGLSFLIFSLLCFVLATRIPFQGSKPYTLLFDPISWEAQVRILSVSTFGAPTIGLVFLRALFPQVVSWRAVMPYAFLGCAMYLVYFGGLFAIATASLFYALIVYPIMGVHVGIVIYRAHRAGFDSILMALGMGCLVLLSLFGFIQNHRGYEGGYYALAASLFFVIFQALALGRFFAGAMRARSELAESLQASSQALAKQREDLQTHLHDSLGGALTDLQIHAERELQKAPVEISEALRGIQDRIRATTQMFRSQLLFLEDLTMAAEDLLPGIQLTLLRRYADAGREIDFDYTAEAAKLVSSSDARALPIMRRLDLFFLMVELGTNDLKHGRGESFWRISASGKNMTIVQSNGRKPGPIERAVPLSAANRVRKLNGRMTVTPTDDDYAVMIELPWRRR